MKFSTVLMASTASAFPFMAKNLETDEAKAQMARDFSEHLGRRAVEYSRLQADDERRGLIGDLLGVGGGLVNGVLQPLSGPLANLGVPTPQEFSLKKIPGNDPKHQFIAPGKTDVRGLCPTLNTLANHGFISRTGITTFAEAANAIQVAYGFGYGLSTFLSALGLIAGGDLLTGKMSIGGADARVPNTLGPSLGISKHGTFEIDGSISRQDTYFGNQGDFIPQRWIDVRKQAISHGGGFYGAQMWIENQRVVYNTARATNPEFNAGVKYFAVSLAERAFMYRALPNGTTVEVADAANVEPFFLLNTFPHNWFRRGSAYDLPNLGLDLVTLYAGYPFELGQNQGTGNFIPLGIDLTDKTPSDLMCFVLTNIFDQAPGFISPQLADLTTGFVGAVISPLFGQFNCAAPTKYVAPSKNCFKCSDAGASTTEPGDGAGKLAKSIPAPGKPLTKAF